MGKTLRYRVGTARRKIVHAWVLLAQSRTRWVWRRRARLFGGARYVPVTVMRDGLRVPAILDRKTGIIVRTLAHVPFAERVVRQYAARLNREGL